LLIAAASLARRPGATILSFNHMVERDRRSFMTDIAFRQALKRLFDVWAKLRDALHFLHFTGRKCCRNFGQCGTIAPNFSTPVRVCAAAQHGIPPVCRWHGY
jgi:hypothetical protein